jgi:hypothetical protein
MNEFVFISKYMVALRRRSIEAEIEFLNCELNRTPMSTLKLVRPKDELKAALERWSP